MNNDEETTTDEKQAFSDIVSEVAQSVSDIEGITTNLKELNRQLSRARAEPTHATELASLLRRAKDREFLLMGKMEHLSSLNAGLSKMDIGLYPKLEEKLSAVSKEEAGHLKEQIEQARKRLVRRDDIRGLFVFAKDLGARFTEALERAMVAVAHNDEDSIKAWLKRAVFMNARFEGLMTKILQIEKELLRLTEGELSEEKAKTAEATS